MQLHRICVVIFILLVATLSFAATPQVTSTTPVTGAAGTQVQINGSGFGTAQGTVTFNGASAAIVSWSDTQIAATVPLAALTGPVVVTAGGQASNSNIYFNVPATVVTSVSPASGTVGTQVTINGSGFQTSKGSSTVYFNNVLATTSSWSNTQIVATVPANALTGPVKVIINGVASNQDVLFSLPNPIITGLAPASGPVNTTVQINGIGFGTTQGLSTIAFNGVNATVTSWSDTQITASMPTTATSGVVKVTVGGVASAQNLTFTVPPPQVSSVSPAAAVPGTQVTVTGSGFQAAKGSNTITFNGFTPSTISSWSDTQIVATIPSGTTTGPVKVAVTSVSSNQDVLFTVPAPLVTSISPVSGPVGTQITVVGSGFGGSKGTSTLQIAGIAVTTTSWSDSQIVGTIPGSGMTGAVVVTVSGVSNHSGDVVFTVASPHVSSVSPTSGVVGTQITINGTGFRPTQSAGGNSSFVYVNGFSCPIVSWSDTQIVATVSASATTGAVTVNGFNANSNTDVVFTLPNPIVNTLSPSSASAGSQFQINGVGFGTSQGGSTVVVNNVTAAIVSWSDTQIVATVPATASTGPVKVAVGGITSNANINLTIPLPHISSISPASGVIGTQVTITGSGFQATKGNNNASIGGSLLTISSWSDTQIVGTVPAGATTNFTRVTINGNDSNREFLFTLPNPVITSFTPTGGATASQIQISGSGFGPTQSTSTAAVNTTNLSVTSWSDTSITGTLPAGTTTGAVKVTVGGVTATSSNFTVANLFVNSFSPKAGPVGTQVTVTGNGFGPSQGSSTVTFNNLAASVVSWGDTQIVATVPASATTGLVKVTVGANSSSTSQSFTVGAVAVNSVSPTSGVAGVQVQISGSGFGLSPGSSSVTFNGVTATTSGWSDGLITATVPASATTGPVKVTVSAVASNTTVSFTVPSPTIGGVTPVSGIVGTQIQVNGVGFGATQGSSALTVNGSTATVSSWSDTAITATVPTGATTGPLRVSVGAVNSNTNVYFTIPVAQVNSISPTSGVVGTQVTVYGSGFHSTQGSGSIAFNGQAGTVVSWSDTQIIATVPGTARTGPVRVTVNGSNSNQDVVFSMPNPTVTSLSPTSGPTGTQVQINGSGFGTTQGSSTITFNGVAATASNWSDTSIIATVPSAAATGSISINAGGVASNTSIKFTVPGPVVSSITPNRATAGAQVTVTGANFQAVHGNSNLVFSGLNAFGTIVSWSDTQIVATVPSSANPLGPISVVVNGVYSNGDTQFALINPRITGLSPTSGPVGTQVQINGTGFGTSQGGSTVSFANNNAGVVSWSDTQIVATVPAASASGAVKVTVATVASNTNINFTVPSPKITSISPNSGVVGSTLTINGSGFQSTPGNSYIYFNNGTYTQSAVSWSDTQIVVTVPAGATGGPLKVVANNGQASNQDVAFSMPNPVVSQLSPTAGPVGTQVQINGIGFGATQGSSSITFNQAAASVVSWSDTQIVATVPAAAAAGAVQVTESGVGSNNNIYFTVPAPQIATISPTVGGVGNSVTITGSGFHAAQGSNTITFNGSSAAVTSWSDTQIAAIVPSNAATGPVRASVNNQPSNVLTYTVPNLVISSLSPTSGPVGTQVTINGTGFGSPQGSSSLTFNGQAATSISTWTNTQVIATVPVTAVTGPARVTVNGINSNATQVFTVPPPVVSTVSPVGGIAGTQVTLAGSGFQASQRDSVLTFNGTPATVSSWSDTQIVATVPTGATSGPLLVTVNSVSSSSSKTFEVPHPTISAITPPEAPVNGTITITGSGFGPSNWYSPDGVSTVYDGFVNFNGVQVGVISWSDTSITATVPSNAVSGSITITKFNATSNASPFSVEGAPSVSGLAPSFGPVGGSVVVSGSGFGSAQSTSTIQFNGVPATVTSWGDSQIVAIVPPGTATGPVGVSVAGVSGSTMNFIVNTSVQVTDSQGHSSSYTSAMIGGTWVGTDATGSGCSSCTIRGTIHDDYDSLGDLTAHTDELGRITNNVYDSNFNLTSATAHLDANTPVTTSYTYNSFGEPLTVTDPLGNVTTNTYDANGNLLTVTSPAPDANTPASVTHFAYDTRGQLTQITDPLNHVTTLSYYPTGLIHTITDAQSNVTSYEYDLRGNRTAVVDALNNRTTFAFDLGNRLTGITYPDSTAVGFAYDSRGRRTSVTDQNGHVTSYAYDDADRLVSVTDAANHVTQYAYDTENNLISITDASLHTTSFSYDAFGRVAQTTFPSTLSESYIYDAAGNLTSKTDRKNQTIQYVYDALNRLTHKGYPDATGVDYVYDLMGKIRQVTDPTGTYGFAYDNMGRLIGTTTQYSFLPGITYTNSYGYDAGSNRTSFTAPDGSTNTYAYDTLGRLSTLTNSLTGQFGFSYDALSRRTALNRPNGVNTAYSYDSLSRLLSVLHNSGTTTIDGASYTYDNAGNRASKANHLNNITESYTYDAIYQLTQVTQGTTTTESYSYDAVGNRLSSLSMPSYAYNSSNELTSTSAATFTYDGNGNTLTKTDLTGTTTYGWDFENRLTSVVLPGSGETVTFKYDPFGRRIQKGSTLTVINYLYDYSDSVTELDPSGTLMARYTQSGDIDEPLAELHSGIVAYYEQDGLGSVTSLSDSSAGLSSSYIYDSFGVTKASTGMTSNPYQFTGRDFDTKTGLRYYRARYYDPAAGRFLTEDPLQFLGSNDFYTYVGNDPTNSVDPLGLKTWPWPKTEPPGQVIPWPKQKPEQSFCTRFPYICALAVPLLPMNSGWDPMAIRCADELNGPPICHGPYTPLLNYHSNRAKERCAAADKNCRPCDPPVGTISHRHDTYGGHTHRGVPTPHWHLSVMTQNPGTCICEWSPIPDNQGGFGPGDPPHGTIPISPAAGGGPK